MCSAWFAATDLASRWGLVGVPSMLDCLPAWATVTAITPVRAPVASTQQFRVLRADDRVALRLWAVERGFATTSSNR